MRLFTQPLDSSLPSQHHPLSLHHLPIQDQRIKISPRRIAFRLDSDLSFAFFANAYQTQNLSVQTSHLDMRMLHLRRDKIIYQSIFSEWIGLVLSK